MRLLDIIVTHYNEPWEIGEKFFSMLDLQRGIHFEDIHVILVHDGTEAFPQTYFENRPYTVEQVCIEHGGLSVCRNAGIKAADAEWINFCDFDDLYFNVCGLRSVLEVLPKATMCDMLVANFVDEMMPNMDLPVYRMMENSDMIFVHGKYYRLDAIRRHGIIFDPALPYNEDGLFNGQLYCAIGPKRRGSIDTQYPVYMWTSRKGSMTFSEGKWWQMMIGMYLRDRKLVDSYEKYMPHSEFCKSIARVIVDSYYLMNYKKFEQQDRYEELHGNMIAFYKKYRRHLDEVEPEALQDIRAVSEEIHTTRKFRFDDPSVPDYCELKPDIPGFWNWVDEMDHKMAEEVKSND